MQMSDPTEPEPVDAEFEPAEDAPRPTKPRISGGIGGYFLTFLIAAFAGGGLGGWIAWTLDQTSAGPVADISGLESRISALEGSPAPVEFDASSLEVRLSALEATPVSTQDPVDLSNIETRIDALEAIDPTAFANPAHVDRIAELEVAARQNEALANQALDQIGAMEGGVDSAVLAALEVRLAAFESEEPSIDIGVDLSPMEARLTALEAQEAPDVFDAEPLTQRLEALESAPPVDLTALTARIEALETRQSEDQSQSATGDTSARQLAARSLALVALIETARSGQSFEAERAALARLWSSQPQLATLADHARSGVPNMEILANTYPRQDIENAIGTNRIFFGLIEVRPSSGSEASPLARVALARERLDRDDLPGAVLLTEQLEGAPLEAAQSWLVQARARLAINSALTDLRAALTIAATETGADPT